MKVQNATQGLRSRVDLLPGLGGIEQAADLRRGEKILGALARIGCFGATGGAKGSTLYISPLDRFRRHGMIPQCSAALVASLLTECAFCKE